MKTCAYAPADIQGIPIAITNQHVILARQTAFLLAVSVQKKLHTRLYVRKNTDI